MKLLKYMPDMFLRPTIYIFLGGYTWYYIASTVRTEGFTLGVVLACLGLLMLLVASVFTDVHRQIARYREREVLKELMNDVAGVEQGLKCKPRNTLDDIIDCHPELIEEILKDDKYWYLEDYIENHNKWKNSQK